MYIHDQKIIVQWSQTKNELLKKVRGVSFEQIEGIIESNRTLEYSKHPNQLIHPGQYIMYVNLNNYVYAVPFIKVGQIIFLKTIFPTRKITKQYRKKNKL